MEHTKYSEELKNTPQKIWNAQPIQVMKKREPDDVTLVWKVYF
jgi:hypothetical protein